ncbi:DUF4167 domain-containing protein [Boseongicola sp. H5]|uniref:DUF4167 domain-containing protein n=1 Tax=Boseongicola sp. H5 TaxID=2763261 RepID=UPI001D09F57B|nr:DUF4167 domain-containing protein [Boseongicola sp. H5]
MRSSKNRSRSKGNRNRSVGNIVNRVFDSSGPEGKVRGTPQQIIDKYNQLARDAQLSNDRVATENFQQHAEHYTRMLSEAQREMDARREAQEAQQNQQNQQRDQRPPRNDDGQQGDQRQPWNDDGDQGDTRNAPQSESGLGDVIDTASAADSGLVETPESTGKPKRTRARRPRKADADSAPDAPAQEASEPKSGNPQEAAE